jgi:ATP/maltotriose-dependent transcriptional regulator MalT
MAFHITSEMLFSLATDLDGSLLRAGVRGYVLKNQAADDLVHAIQEVCRGSIYLSPNISRAVVDAYLSKTHNSDDPLSGRERQVLPLVGEGKSTKDIAAHLGISVKTVESHRARLMKNPPRFDPGLTAPLEGFFPRPFSVISPSRNG